MVRVISGKEFYGGRKIFGETSVVRTNKCILAALACCVVSIISLLKIAAEALVRGYW